LTVLFVDEKIKFGNRTREPDSGTGLGNRIWEPDSGTGLGELDSGTGLGNRTRELDLYLFITLRNFGRLLIHFFRQFHEKLIGKFDVMVIFVYYFTEFRKTFNSFFPSISRKVDWWIWRGKNKSLRSNLIWNSRLISRLFKWSSLFSLTNKISVNSYFKILFFFINFSVKMIISKITTLLSMFSSRPQNFFCQQIKTFRQFPCSWTSPEMGDFSPSISRWFKKKLLCF
jgi:hypothetical protein